MHGRIFAIIAEPVQADGDTYLSPSQLNLIDSSE